ncbi:hypothetical protein DWZ04_12135 [Faecalibacterium prausnitzii]|uniref:Uncharacterized protein n=1 Tax=Faecalibacterium prausnitzii TaxID=853 RepID=A0A3E2UFS7_9FIRM|nr:hypothetical protein DWZ04_12135 [Faecalibacterium prausnitzii]
MVSAGALTIFSGKIILYFGTPERLRTLRCSIFTGGVVTENGSCSAAFCESAALRKGFLLTFSAEVSDAIRNFLTIQKSSPFRGSWHRAAMTERVYSPNSTTA